MRYSIQVKFNKDFVKAERGKIVVGVKAKPEKGKANEEVLRKVARHFKVPASSVKIISGQTSRRKVIEVL